MKVKTLKHTVVLGSIEWADTTLELENELAEELIRQGLVVAVEDDAAPDVKETQHG